MALLRQLGTIYYTYHDDDGPYSVKPGEQHYRYFQARYEHWKQEQADQRAKAAGSRGAGRDCGSYAGNTAEE